MVESSYIAVAAELRYLSARWRVEGFVREANARKYELRLYEQPFAGSAFVTDDRCVGCFVCNVDPSAGLHEALAKWGKPIVEASRKIETKWPQVFVDEDRLADIAAEHLRILQRRHYAYCGRVNNLGSRERQDAFRKRISQFGIDLVSLDLSSASDAGSPARLSAFISQLDFPACLFCYDDRIAEKVVERCKELEVALPGDLAVLSCGDDPLLGSLSMPGISSVIFPAEGLGKASAALLADLMHGKPVAEKVVRIAPLGVRVRDSTDPTCSSDPVISKALRVIREECSLPISVSDIARKVGVSRRGLETRFSQKLSSSVYSFVQASRMELARDLISGSSISLEEVATRCGFTSASTFSRAFRSWYGDPPSTFRSR